MENGGTARDSGTGYLHSAYARALAESGTPSALAASGAWVIERTIPGADVCDAMGPYPIFACRQWTGLAEDLATLGRRVIAVSLVADPFGGYEPKNLRALFPDLCRPYKDHLVVDLRASLSLPVGHRRNLRRAATRVAVEIPSDPLAFASQWTSLYGGLVARRHLRGLSAFSAVSLTQQLRVPGVTMFRAVCDDCTVGIAVWYTVNDVAYYHLGACSPMGYAVGASFAIFGTAIDHFRSRVRWLNLGAGAGAVGDVSDGLTRFKSGWATGRRTAWLCGRVFDRPRYEELSEAMGVVGSTYFPAYRSGEFA
jgi:hypothetical protein